MAYNIPYIFVRGRVTRGLGRSRSYLEREEYRQMFREGLKIDPRFGTLNLSLDDENMRKLRDIDWHSGIPIDGFEQNGEQHGAAEAYPAQIGKTECAVVIPEEREIYRIMEVVSNYHLRRRLNLEDGDVLDVKVFIKPEESWL